MEPASTSPPERLGGGRTPDPVSSPCSMCGRPRKPTQEVCSPRCRAKRHRLRQAARVREVMELLMAALKRLGDGT